MHHVILYLIRSKTQIFDSAEFLLSTVSVECIFTGNTDWFDWFGMVCFANKNKNCQLSYSWFQTSQTGGQWHNDTSLLSISRFLSIIFLPQTGTLIFCPVTLGSSHGEQYLLFTVLETWWQCYTNFFSFTGKEAKWARVFALTPLFPSRIFYKTTFARRSNVLSLHFRLVFPGQTLLHISPQY